VVDRFVEWCGLNHLQHNIAKTKKLVVDFRKQPGSNQSRSGGMRWTLLRNTLFKKYLGVHIDNKMDWTKNTEVLSKKGQSHLYFLQRLRFFNVCKTML